MTLIDLPPRVAAKLEGPVVTTVFDTFDAANISRKEWDDVVIDTGGDIYSSYDWSRIWWRHYGKKRDLRLFVFRQQDRLIGLAPMSQAWRKLRDKTSAGS
jgi:hypothetical protein